MNYLFRKTSEDLDEKIHKLSEISSDSLIIYEAIIKEVLKSIAILKKFILEKGFKSQHQEIEFFKFQKPQIVSKMIYYNSIYKIESKSPSWSDVELKNYLFNELKLLKTFFKDNSEFYKYYRRNHNYLDKEYFLRGKQNIRFDLDTRYFESDFRFSTTHDYKVANIIANEMLYSYLENQIASIPVQRIRKNQSVRWTASKTSLIELLYALHYSKVFNDGKVDIKTIAVLFENMFNIQLGDFYHTYLELRNRKINRTKFLDTIQDNLIEKMNQQEEK